MDKGLLIIVALSLVLVLLLVIMFVEAWRGYQKDKQQERMDAIAKASSFEWGDIEEDL